jgi:Ca-activated chloride channel family protein
LPPKKSRPEEPSHTGARAGRRATPPRLWALLALLLCAPAALAQSQKPAQPEAAPTPYVRQRTVSPKGEAAPPQTSQPPASTPQTPPPANAAPTTQPAAPQSGDPSGQNAGQDSEEVDENEVVRVESNLVIIPASVVDGRGRAITDLKVEDFELKVDGEVKAIGDLSRTDTPVNVALLFDNSNSLSAAREFEKQAAVRFFQAVVRPIDRAAVYSISTTPTLAQNLTNDVPKLVRTIERFGKPDGATALFDALAQAAEYMRPVNGRKVLILVSDGTDTVSDTSFEDAVNKALRAECQVYVVQTRQVEDPNLHDPVSEQRMYRITEQTGGAVFVPRTVEELDDVFTQISRDLSQQYLLSYYPQDDRKDKFFRFINLSVKSRPSLRVRARKGFYPPSAAQAAAAANADRGQYAGALSGGTVPQYVAANRTPQTNADASTPRKSAGPAPANTPRRAAAPGRARPGPDGPDADEPARTAAPDSNEPTPTFTLVTSAPAASRPAPTPTPAPAETTPAMVAEASKPTAEAPRLTAPAPTFTPAPAPTPAPSPTRSPTSSLSASSNVFTIDTTPTPKVRTETDAGPRDVKAADAEKAPAASQPAEAARPAESEKPKPPLSGGVLNTKAVSLPKPMYPAAAKNSGAQGRVVVEVVIDERGKVVEAHAVSGHPFLQAAAVQAARQARFAPALLSGAPVKIKGTINYVFTLP